MSRLDDFRYATPLRRLNKLVQLLLALCLIAGVNALASRHYFRADLARQGVYALSPESMAYLRELKAPVHVVVTIPEQGDSADSGQKLLRRYVKNLLEEYREASRRGGKEMLSVEYVDPYRNPRRAAELARQYKVEQVNAVIFSSANRQRVVGPAEILEFENLKPVAYKGEQAFTSAILETASESTPVIYFTSGHGEMSPEDVSPGRGLSVVAAELRARNMEPRLLDLSRGEVPGDAALVIVADPVGSFLPEEVVRLRSYLDERSGRLVLLLGAGRETGLERFLLRWGISADNMLVQERAADNVDSGGAIIVRSFAESPVTDILRRNKAPLLAGQARPISAGQMASEPGTRLSVLMASSAKSWADAGWRNETEPLFNPGIDQAGPVPLAVLAQTGARSGTGISLPGARILAIGLGDVFSNRYMGSFGNQALFFSITSWMSDREQLIAIEPRVIEQYQLSLSREELGRLALLLCVPAGVLALMGLITALLRRY